MEWTLAEQSEYIDFTAPGRVERGFYVLTNINQCPAWAWGIYEDDENWVKRGTIPRSRTVHCFLPDKIPDVKKGYWCEYCRENGEFSWVVDKNSECDGTPCIEIIVKRKEEIRRENELKNKGLVNEQPVVSGLVFKQPVVKEKKKHPVKKKPPDVKPWPEPREPAPLGEFFADKPVTYFVRSPLRGDVFRKGESYLRRGGFPDCPYCNHNHCKLIHWNDGGWDVMCPKCGCLGVTRNFKTKEKAFVFWREMTLKKEENHG